MIIVKQKQSGIWIAEKVGEKRVVGRGDSSVEAHCDLLEKLAPQTEAKS